MPLDKKQKAVQYRLIPSTLHFVAHIEDITDPIETETYKIKSVDDEDNGISESKISISHD